MAGEWIEYEKSLPEKPEVLRISSILNIDRFAVVGRLLEIWSWFDSHTEDGNALGVTKVFLDEKVGVTHFCDAMIESGWLVEITEPCNGLSVTNFGKHNGKSAKKRLKTNQRVAKLRNETQKKQKCNAQSVTKSVTTEQNRTEQYNTLSLRREGVQDSIIEEKPTGPPPDPKTESISSDSEPSFTVHSNGLEKFPMYRGWEPDPNELAVSCMRYGVPREQITQDVLNNHVDYWAEQGEIKSEAGWTSKLVSQFKIFRDSGKGANHAKSQRASSGFTNSKQSKYSDIQDIIEGEAFGNTQYHPRAEREINTGHQTHN